MIKYLICITYDFSGLVKRRWQPFVRDQRSILELVLKGNFVQVNNEAKIVNSTVNEELNEGFKNFWAKYAASPLVGRNIILSSFSPQVGIKRNRFIGINNLSCSSF